MRLEDLQPGQPRKARKRIGRGAGSGSGKTSGRGQKGQGSRAGGNVRPGFEGGQTPLQMRTPKLRGANKKRSNNIGLFRTSPAIANVGSFERFGAGAVVDQALLVEHGLCRAGKDGLRILGDGELTVAVTVRAAHVSASARTKIEAAGGTVELLGGAAE